MEKIALTIDTSILKHLIDKLTPSDGLTQLDYWITNGYIDFLVPEALKREWQKHRELELLGIKKAVSEHAKHVKKSQLFEIETIGDPDLSIAERKLQLQVEIVDKLVQQGIQLPESDRIIVLVHKHESKGLAPFHNKKDSKNDAFLIFSSLEFVEESRGRSLFFLSANTKEFESIDNHGTIHPQIQSQFKDVPIVFFNTWSSAYRQLLQQGLPAVKKPVSHVKNRIGTDRNAPVATQLYQYFEKQFAQFNFLPRQFFNFHPPLITSKISQLIIEQPFTLITDNKDLYNEIKTLTEGTTLSRELEFIHDIFQRNAIFKLAIDFREEVHYIYPPDTNNQSIGSLFADLHFDLCYNKIKEKESADPTLEKAYYLYKFKEYDEAIRLLFTVIEKSEQQNKLSLAYIASYNISKLAKLKTYVHTTSGQESPLVIDLNEKLNLYKDVINEDILDAIKDEGYLNQVEKNIQNEVNKIRESNFNRTRGWDMHYSILLNQMHDLHCFFSKNFIVFDDFYEYKKIVSLFIEGSIASFGSSPELGSKLKFFPDWVVWLMLSYGDYKELQKYCQWYEIKTLLAQPDDNNTFKIIASWIRSYLSIENQPFYFNLHPEFDIYCQRLILNSLTLFSLFEIPHELLLGFSENVLLLLENRSFRVVYYFLELVEYFVIKKGALLPPSITTKILVINLTNQDLQKENLTIALTNIYRINGFLPELTVETTDEIETYLTVEYLSVRDEFFSSICIIYEFLSTGEFKTKIKNSIIRCIEAINGPTQYYQAVLYNIIDPESSRNEAYMTYVLEIAKKGVQPRPFTREGFYHDIRIDSYLNFLFKIGIPPAEEIKDELKNLDIYYQWLMDLDGFDYARFDMKWPLLYFTKYYKAHFAKSAKLKEYLLDYLKKNPLDAKASMLLINTYFRQ